MAPLGRGRLQKALWNSASFYNFVQHSLKSREGKDRPSPENWEMAWNTLLGIVDILRPTHILFCGVEAANAFHRLEKSINWQGFKVTVWKKAKVGRTYLRTGSLSNPAEGYSAKLTFIGHPSSFFSWSNWAKCIKERFTIADRV